MKQGSQWIEELLILSRQPEDGNDRPDWRPFAGGQTLEEFVARHNRLCREAVLENTSNQLVACADSVTPVLKIRQVHLDNLTGRDRFKLGRPALLLLDLDTLQGAADQLEELRKAFSQQKRLLHLLQVSGSAQAQSYAPIFESTACVLLGEREIFCQEEELNEFFNTFGRAHGDVWHGIARNPYDAPCRNGLYAEPFVHPRHGHFIQPMSDSGETIRRVFLAYRDALPAIAARTRNIALARKLDTEQSRNLGRASAIQELLLDLVAETVRRRPVYPVSVENIRFPLVQVPVDEPLELNQLREMKLVAVHLRPSKLQPAQEECEKLAGLGVAKGAFAAVHRDRPGLWQRLEGLGEIVSAEQFTAELPAWNDKPRRGDLSLNEACFGVRIEESYSRGMAK
jgi:hypothetical protein